MIPGFKGHLLSEAFLEQPLPLFEPPPKDIEVMCRALRAWRTRSWALGPASSLRAIVDQGARPLVDILGIGTMGDLQASERFVSATATSASGPTAVLTALWGERLDPLARTAVREALRRGAKCAMVFNGIELRIVPAGAVFGTRYAAIDLDTALDDQAACRALVLLARAIAEAESDAGVARLRDLVDASDRFARDVSRALKEGVLAASGHVTAALVRDRGRVHDAELDAAFEQALTIVYRLLFLLFAEGRNLVPTWHPVYRESYTVGAMQDAAHNERSAGLWDAFRAITRLAHRGCVAGDLRVTPFNGRLFAPARTPLAERRSLNDRRMGSAVVELATRPSSVGREPISYRDLGVEQLGAVYETLLDYRPQSTGTGVVLATGSRLRKATGTFYTPQAIADYLVHRTLGPLVENRTPDEILGLRIVDPAMGSGAFLVAACRYLADRYEAALIVAGACHPADVDERQRAGFRRLVADRCLYGVDVNPMAVQLARLSLWLATLAADQPLTFLDHRLVTGNSILGAWLSMLARPPRSLKVSRRRDEATLPFDEAVRDALLVALPVRFALELTPDDTVEAVHAKERALASIEHKQSWITIWKRIADLWCSAWLNGPAPVPPRAFGPLSDALLNRPSSLPGPAVARLLAAADHAVHGRHLFHWELEFPEVFFAADGTRRPNGGFDAIIGNPPWDMIRSDPAARDGHGPEWTDPASVVRFTRTSGAFSAQSEGHANYYQLFLERAVALCRTGGRIGLALPSGIVTDHGSGRLRHFLFAGCHVESVDGFDNRRAVFPIHRSVRFVLLVAERGTPTGNIRCRFGLDDLAALGRAQGSLNIPMALIERISARDLAIPWLEHARDLALVERSATLFPPLGASNGWNCRFGRELNATEDRHLFGGPGHGLPIVEGKQIEPFRVEVSSSRHSIPPGAARSAVRDERFRRRRLGYRDVASATNRLTLISAMLPAGLVSTHTVFTLKTPLSLRDQWFLCGLFNSFVLNHLVRLRVTTHVTTAIVEALPVPTSAQAGAAMRDIAALSHVMSRREDSTAFARLQAEVAALYQLTADDFEHVLSTFPLVSQTTRDAALRTFRNRGSHYNLV